MPKTITFWAGLDTDDDAAIGTDWTGERLNIYHTREEAEARHARVRQVEITCLGTVKKSRVAA